MNSGLIRARLVVQPLMKKSLLSHLRMPLLGRYQKGTVSWEIPSFCLPAYFPNNLTALGEAFTTCPFDISVRLHLMNFPTHRLTNLPCIVNSMFVDK